MRVLLIHQAFATPNEPGGTRHFEFARGAVQRGYHFTVVASNISYITGKSTKNGVRSEHEELLEGIRILRAFTYDTLHGSFAGRIFSLVTFAASSFICALRAGKVDVVIGTSPSIFQAVTAWLVAALRRRPLLLEIRDLWPEFIIDMGALRNPLIIRLSRWLESFLYSRAAHLVVNSPAYVDYLINKGIPIDKITLIPNGVDPSLFDPSSNGNGVREKLKLEGKFVVLYAGAVGPANDLDLVLRAAKYFVKDSPVCFLIVGDGKERQRLEAHARAHGLANVVFAGPQPKCDMPKFIASADACVAVLQNIPMFRMTYPNKVFDYMASGRPVVLAIDGVIRQVVETAKAGLFTEPGDAKSLADAVRFLVSHQEERRVMSLNGRSFVEKHFNRANQTDQFVSLLQSLVRG